MIFIPNYHWNHTKFEFGMIPVAIWYENHTSVFAVYGYYSKIIIYLELNPAEVVIVVLDSVKQYSVADSSPNEPPVLWYIYAYTKLACI